VLADIIGSGAVPLVRLTEVFRQAAAIDIADDQKRRVVWRRFHERLHQQDVDNRGLVGDEQIALEGIVGASVGTRERVGVGENVRAAYLVMQKER
jgi:hypothetical protein